MKISSKTTLLTSAVILWNSSVISRRETVFRDHCFYELATTCSYSRRPDFEIWDLEKKNLQQTVRKIHQSSTKTEVGSLWCWSLQGHPALQFSPQWQLQPWGRSHRTPAQGARRPHCGVSALLPCASFPANSGGSPPRSAFPPSDGHPGPQPQRSSPITNGGIKISPRGQEKIKEHGTIRRKECERTTYKVNREKRLRLHVRESIWKYAYILTERVGKEERVQFGRGNGCGRYLLWEIKRIRIWNVLSQGKKLLLFCQWSRWESKLLHLWLSSQKGKCNKFCWERHRKCKHRDNFCG